MGVWERLEKSTAKVGIEPIAYGFPAQRSTIELHATQVQLHLEGTYILIFILTMPVVLHHIFVGLGKVTKINCQGGNRTHRLQQWMIRKVEIINCPGAIQPRCHVAQWQSSGPETRRRWVRFGFQFHVNIFRVTTPKFYPEFIFEYLLRNSSRTLYSSIYFEILL